MKNVATKETSLNDTSKDIVIHHLSSFHDNNLQALMSDYTPESVLITQNASFTGPAEIQVFFEGLMVHFPTQKSDFELDKIVVNEGLVYIVWHAKTPTLEVSLGSDTFVIKDGKISQQTFVGQMKFLN